METRYQTEARHAHGGLGLLACTPSPYTRDMSGIGHVGRNTNKFLRMIAIVEQIDSTLNSYRVRVGFNDSGTGLGPTTFLIPFSSVTTFPDDMPALVTAGVNQVCDDNSLARPDSYQYTDIVAQFITAVPMMVAGVAKSSTYAVVGAPAVAGGAGVARFYIDSNGDGTGTAPSEVYASSLQAVIVNSTSSYVLTGVSVDTNRKYIDVTMKALTFAGITVAGIGVLGSQSLVAAANATVVNCSVFVKK